jgi:divalent metal cation (Fe/Co/Zn/Cd) transporter
VENLVAVAAIVPVPLLFDTYEMKVGERYSSPRLAADGRRFRADVLTDFLVFAALAG